MKKRDIKKLAGNPDFISGIYNYCDRWCERCAMTARCMVFAMEKADGPTEEQRDGKNKTFWKTLEETFHVTGEMMRDATNERGIQFDPRELEAIGRQVERRRRRAEKHPLAQAASDYGSMTDRWFKEEEALLFEKEEEVRTKARLGVASVREEVASLTDVVEVIRWYQHQIYVKLMSGLNRDPGRDTDVADVPNDSDGSVKIALIGIDRSIAAWARMKDHFPEKTDDILSFLLHLDRLRRAAEKEFSNARKFVRPGFDPAPGTGRGGRN